MRYKGFTLVEVSVVLAIIAILILLLLPAIHQARLMTIESQQYKQVMTDPEFTRMLERDYQPLWIEAIADITGSRAKVIALAKVKGYIREKREE